MRVKNVVEETPSATFGLHRSVRRGKEVEDRGETGDCYVKCMVCGRRLHVVHTNHLKKHGLTIEQYRSKFPRAKIYSDRYIRSLKKRYCKTIGRKRVKTCVNCGAAFATNAPNKFMCDLCQRKHKLESGRSRERLRRRSWRGVKQTLGTKGPSVNLTVLPNGRVAAAVWLEKHKGKKHRMMLNGDGRLQCPDCNSTYLMFIEYGQPYCMECGGKITLAPENKHYTTTELCCSKCGLVYETPTA